MNTIWLKIAGGAVLTLVIVIAVASFMGGDSPSDDPQAQASNPTFEDTVEKDRQQHPVVPPEPIEEVVARDPQVLEATPPVATVPVDNVTIEPEPAESNPKVVYVKALQDFEEIQAQQLLSFAGTSLSIGRLPVMQYGTAVRGCKDVIQRWPESWYAYQAKRILTDIAETSSRYRKQYNLTEDVLDVSQFYQKRPGTQALPLSD